MEAAGEAIAAAVGGVVSSVVLHPLDTLKTQVQAGRVRAGRGSAAGRVCVDSGLGTPRTVRQPEETRLQQPAQERKREDGDGEDEGEGADGAASAPEDASVLAVARAMYAEGGAPRFFRGVGVGAVQSAVEKSIYFLVYSLLKDGARYANGGRAPGPAQSLLLGYASDWSHLFATLPFEVVCRNLQTARGAGRGSSAPYAVLQAVLSEGGVAGLYRGWQAYLVLCLRPAIQYSIYDSLKRAMTAKRREKALGAGEAFLLGAFSRAVATVLLYPYARAKTVRMTEKNGGEPRSVGQVVRGILKDEGAAGLFKGLAPELLRGVFSAAIMLMVKEKVQRATRKALRGAAAGRRRR